MVNEQEEIKLGYLLDPCFELSNTAGKPLTNGWIEVYIHGTRNKYYCYSDFGGTLHPFKIPLDSLGSNIVLADPERAYDVYVYNRFGSLEMSRYNVSPGHAGGAAISSGGNAEHWIGRYGATIEVAANEYSDSIPLPIDPDYEGTFIDHISDNKNIVLKDGLYLVDCLLSFRQNPDSLNNTLGYVHVFTGLDDGESGVFQRNETLPDTDPDETHNIRVQFVRHVEGSTGCNVCFQVRTTNAWSFVRIQGLSIVKLGAGGGIAPQPIEYDAGQYVSIDNDVISVTGLQPSGDYADASSVSQGFYDVNQQLNALSGQINEVSGQIPSLDGYATEEWVRQQNYLTEVPSQYVTESELNSAISGKADKSEIPSLDGYATQEYVQSAVSGKQDELEFTYDADDKITTIDGHGIAGTGGGGGSGSVYTPGQYISIQNDIISVTGLQPSGDYQPAGDYLTQESLNGYATDDDVQAAVSGKADKSEIPSLSGYATEQYVQSEVSGKADKSEIPSLDGYATETWVGEQNFATVDDVDEATSGKLDTSAYTAPVNADWNSQSSLSQILNKPEASQLIPGSGISIVPSGDNYIINSFGGGTTYTEGEYIKIENNVISVTGLQPSGEYLVPSDLNGYATTDYVTSATSGKQDTLQFTYNEDDKISAINGSAIAGGSEVQIGVMVESGLQYNAVGEISGYGESAIAQYGAEKQWLVHDDTIVHQSNSAQYAFGVNISATSQLMGVDETVLFTSDTGVQDNITLSENIENFEFIRVEWCPYTESSNWTAPYDLVTTKVNGGLLHLCGFGLSDNTTYQIQTNMLLACSTTSVTVSKCGTITTSPTESKTSSLTGYKIYKIIGIGRKQSN